MESENHIERVVHQARRGDPIGEPASCRRNGSRVVRHADSVVPKTPDRTRLLAGQQDAETASVQVRLMCSEADIEATWPLYRALHRESRYAPFRPNKDKRAHYLRENMLGKPDRFGLIIAEWRGQPVGFLGCVANRLLYGDETFSSCLSFYVSPSCRKTLLGGRVAVKLLDAYRRWAMNRKVVEIQFHVTSGIGIAGTDRFLRRAGFRQTGGNYSLDLPLQPNGEGR